MGQCLECSIMFGKYRKVLNFCSRKCAKKFQSKKYQSDYIEKTKERFVKNFRECEKTGCWVWTKDYKDSYGRGYLWFKGTTILASRVSYMLYCGEIPKEICVCHTCDNYSCVNPKHFFLGSHKDNAEDRVNKQRSANGEKLSKKLKNEDVLKIRDLHKKNKSQDFISRMFGVTQTAISRIVRRKTWNHL